MKSYYEILGVSKTATAQDIKKAFRKLAQKFHPDRNPGNQEAAKKMVQLNEAYAVIGNPKLRKEYDARMSGNVRTGKTGNGGFTSAYEDERRAKQYENAQQFYADYEFEGFNEFLNKSWSFFGDSLASMFGVTASSEDLFSDLYLTPEEAYNGCRKLFVFEKPALCHSCYGNSVWNDFYDCPVCQNHGKILVERKLWITIPPYTPNMKQLRLKSEGSAMESEQPGDLILTVYINSQGKEPERTEFNHRVEVTIDLKKAIQGGPLIVNGPTGPLRINLPKESYPGKKIRVKNEGHINMDNMKRGHLYITLNVAFPKDPTRTELDQIERLKQKAG